MKEASDAAKFLGVSIRTLQRYVTEGRLTAHSRKGRTKPVPIYDEAELEALKATLSPAPSEEKTPPILVSKAATPPEKTTRTPNTQTKKTATLPLTLPAHYMDRLKAEGAERGQSADEYARSIMIDALEDGERRRLREEIQEMKRILHLLGMDIANAALVLLLHAGRIENETEAREWIRANLQGSLPSADHEKQ